MRFIRGDSLKEAIDRFHTDETPRRATRASAVAGTAEAPASVPGRLQRD